MYPAAASWHNTDAQRFCDKSVAIGFDLESRPTAPGSRDELMATNIRLECSNGKLTRPPAHQVAPGVYSGVNMCPDHHAVCGVRNQVLPYANDPKVDNVGITNVDHLPDMQGSGGNDTRACNACRTWTRSG
jgi:hypothetical protein